MSYVSSIIIMTSLWNEEVFEKIKQGFIDDMHHLPRDFKEINLEECGGTKHVEAKVFACGANYVDEEVFLNWAKDLKRTSPGGDKIGIIYTINGGSILWVDGNTIQGELE